MASFSYEVCENVSTVPKVLIAPSPPGPPYARSTSPNKHIPFPRLHLTVQFPLAIRQATWFKPKAIESPPPKYNVSLFQADSQEEQLQV